MEQHAASRTPARHACHSRRSFRSTGPPRTTATAAQQDTACPQDRSHKNTKRPATLALEDSQTGPQPHGEQGFLPDPRRRVQRPPSQKRNRVFFLAQAVSTRHHYRRRENTRCTPRCPLAGRTAAPPRCRTTHPTPPAPRRHSIRHPPHSRPRLWFPRLPSAALQPTHSRHSIRHPPHSLTRAHRSQPDARSVPPPSPAAARHPSACTIRPHTSGTALARHPRTLQKYPFLQSRPFAKTPDIENVDNCKNIMFCKGDTAFICFKNSLF